MLLVHFFKPYILKDKFYTFPLDPVPRSWTWYDKDEKHVTGEQVKYVLVFASIQHFGEVLDNVAKCHVVVAKDTLCPYNLPFLTSTQPCYPFSKHLVCDIFGGRPDIMKWQ